MANGDSVRLATGQLDFSAGVDSSRVTTIASPGNPNGLPVNALAWANNCTMRGGGITQRTGYTKIATIHDSSGLFNGAFMYQQRGGFPYIIVAISGQFFRIRVDTDNSIDDITQGNTFPATEPLYHFAQGNEFLVIQAGDYTTLPLFWDGTTMRRSNGITGFLTTEPASSQHNFYATAFWKVPPVGSNVVIQLSQAYPGVVGDIGPVKYATGSFDIGQFQVIAVEVTPGMAPFTVELQTLSSSRVGENYAPESIVPGGFILTVTSADTNLVNELPAAGPMKYYQGRIWYAGLQIYTAGDITGGLSGTAAVQQRDSILKVTENPLAIGGDGFAIPSESGNIRALEYVANNDATLGEGTLFIFTRQQVFANDIPITREDWVISKSNTPPKQRVVQRTNGAVSDRAIVSVNGDLFYQSLEPGVRSLFTALRYFGTWGNGQISNNIERALNFSDRSLMRWDSGIEFGNRMYQAILPEQRAQGVVCRAIAVMDFEPLSTLQERQQPNWEGVQQGLNVLQLLKGDFGGKERAFAITVSDDDGSINLYEITNDQRTDSEDRAVTWFAETPAFTWNNPFALKKLDGGELWIDRLFGTVIIKVYFRTDANVCWRLWHVTKLCSTRSSCETLEDPICYPEEVHCESGKIPIQFPVPPLPACSAINSRPETWFYQAQIKLEITGWLRVRGLIVFATPRLQQPFSSLSCVPGPFTT